MKNGRSHVHALQMLPGVQDGCHLNSGEMVFRQVTFYFPSCRMILR